MLKVWIDGVEVNGLSKNMPNLAGWPNGQSEQYVSSELMRILSRHNGFEWSDAQCARKKSSGVLLVAVRVEGALEYTEEQERIMQENAKRIIADGVAENSIEARREYLKRSA